MNTPEFSIVAVGHPSRERQIWARVQDQQEFTVLVATCPSWHEAIRVRDALTQAFKTDREYYEFADPACVNAGVVDQPAGGDFRDLARRHRNKGEPVMESNIFDVQASEPYDYKESDGSIRRVVPKHVNKRLHVLAPTMERAMELMHEHHPEAVLHQIIKRNSVTDVIVDPDVLRDEGE